MEIWLVFLYMCWNCCFSYYNWCDGIYLYFAPSVGVAVVCICI